MKQYTGTYTTMVTLENLLQAWQEFLRGKRNREDVIRFEAELIDSIFALQRDLLNKTYTHSKYHAFNISDPKPRNIHKASVRDRLIHHLLYSALYPYFDTKFIFDSYSCRTGKGTHKAVYRFEAFARMLSKNYTKTCWVLKCDIKKFFASIDHGVLKTVLVTHIADPDIRWLLEQIINSFNTPDKHGVGLPLGNLTSQLLVNVYMNEFDHFVKHTLKMKYYIRYADDFVFLSNDKQELESLIPKLETFLSTLKLSLHEKKLYLKTFSSGIDFLGWVHFPTHRVLRTTTKRRMLKRIQEHLTKETLASYGGMLVHGNAYTLARDIAKKEEEIKNSVR